MARILVIEDEDIVRATICAMLEGNGHEVAEAADGDEGIAIQKEKPFGIVICDIFMPHKEGLETIAELKRDYPDLKIIAISGSKFGKNQESLKRAKKYGADRALSKPFTEDDFLEAVNACLQESE